MPSHPLSPQVRSRITVMHSYFLLSMWKQHKHTMNCLLPSVPAPPTHLQVVNVTDTRAVLQWTPSLGKVDRFIISYESSKSEFYYITLFEWLMTKRYQFSFIFFSTAPNVTVTVMLSGNSVEHQLRGLQRGTLYTVKVLSQKDSLQSMAISTTFTTAHGK